MNKRENIYSLHGIDKVFKFTLIQTFKNKAYVLSFVLFVLVMTFMGPLQYIMSKNGEDTAKALEADFENIGIKNVYVFNDTPVEFNLSEINKEDNEDITSEISRTDDGIRIGNVKFVDSTDKTFSSRNEWLREEDAIIYIHTVDEGIEVSGIRKDSSDIDTGELDDVTAVIKDNYEKARLRNINISNEDIIKISSGVHTDGVVKEADYVAEQSKTISGQKYYTYILGFSVIVMMIVSVSNSFIIASVTEEKQSKLVESLLVSVRPMALLMGKIFGMMAYVLSILVCGFIGSKISDIVLKSVMKVSEENYSGSGFDLSIFKQFGPSGFVIMLVALMLGYLTFGIVGGIFGSACNTTEDIQSATGSVMVFVMTGYMGAMFMGMMDKNILNLIMAFVPPFSYFSAPIMYVTGRIELWSLLLSFVLQTVIVVLLTRLCAKTYRNLILSDSSTPKIKAIFKSAKV